MNFDLLFPFENDGRDLFSVCVVRFEKFVVRRTDLFEPFGQKTFPGRSISEEKNLSIRRFGHREKFFDNLSFLI